ncbi:MAG: hypothetical protein DDT21_01864 [Syntrophomonadaceae bacterium]|nr:hypothetical protein [Bacillota bacterium]
MDNNEILTNNLQQSANPVLRKPNYKRRKADRRADQTLAAVLASTGLVKPQAIADAINGRAGDRYQITVSQVRQDIATGLARYKDIAPDDPEDARLLQIARLDMIRTLALDAYIDSQTTVTTTETIDNEGRSRTSTSTKKTAPDAKYLSVIKDIEIERNLILGVRAPERREEHGELTVVFAWKETPQTGQNALPEPVDADYRLADSEPDTPK